MERAEKHTKGIWECNVYDRPLEAHVEISCHAQQRRIAMTPSIDEEDIANAQLIVTAANNHDKLKEALKAFMALPMSNGHDLMQLQQHYAPLLLSLEPSKEKE